MVETMLIPPSNAIGVSKRLTSQSIKPVMNWAGTTSSIMI